MTVLLEVTGLTVQYGPVRAVDGVDLRVDEGQIVGLIGPNGAGKTTMIDALTGFVPSTGSVTFSGATLDGSPAHRRARAGLGRTWQSLELFDDLTVRENLQVAAETPSFGGLLLDLVRPTRARDGSGVDFALDAVGIRDLADRLPTEISHGQRKLVSTARALAGRPRLVLMDEPAAGLDQDESRALAMELRALRDDSGITILLVDHDMALVLEVCDRIVVIEFGRVIAEGTPDEITKHPEVLRAYLGADGAPS